MQVRYLDRRLIVLLLQLVEVNLELIALKVDLQVFSLSIA